MPTKIRPHSSYCSLKHPPSSPIAQLFLFNNQEKLNNAPSAPIATRTDIPLPDEPLATVRRRAKQCHPADAPLATVRMRAPRRRFLNTRGDYSFAHKNMPARFLLPIKIFPVPSYCPRKSGPFLPFAHESSFNYQEKLNKCALSRPLPPARPPHYRTSHSQLSAFERSDASLQRTSPSPLVTARPPSPNERSANVRPCGRAPRQPSASERRNATPPRLHHPDTPQSRNHPTKQSATPTFGPSKCDLLSPIAYSFHFNYQEKLNNLPELFLCMPSFIGRLFSFSGLW